jgi:hypothetical protein
MPFSQVEWDGVKEPFWGEVPHWKGAFDEKSLNLRFSKDILLELWSQFWGEDFSRKRLSMEAWKS